MLVCVASTEMFTRYPPLCPEIYGRFNCKYYAYIYVLFRTIRHIQQSGRNLPVVMVLPVVYM